MRYRRSVSFVTSAAVRSHLVRALEADLVGPYEELEELDRAPSRTYLTGFLVPALMLLDWRFLTVIGSYWPITFDKGILNTGLPYFTILALLIMVLLAVAGEPTESRRVLWRRRRVSCECGWLASAGALALGAVSVGLFALWLAAMARGSMTSPFAADAVRVGRAASVVALAAMVPFLWIVLAETLSRPPGPLEGPKH